MTNNQQAVENITNVLQLMSEINSTLLMIIQLLENNKDQDYENNQSNISPDFQDDFATILTLGLSNVLSVDEAEAKLREMYPEKFEGKPVSEEKPKLEWKPMFNDSSTHIIAKTPDYIINIIPCLNQELEDSFILVCKEQKYQHQVDDLFTCTNLKSIEQAKELAEILVEFYSKNN